MDDRALGRLPCGVYAQSQGQIGDSVGAPSWERRKATRLSCGRQPRSWRVSGCAVFQYAALSSPVFGHSPGPVFDRTAGRGDEPAGKKLPDPADSSRDTLGAETYQGGRHCHGDVDGTVASFVQSSSCSHPQMP